ncbi:MAG: CRTAC1 family protein [Planctomycetota bacterium]
MRTLPGRNAACALLLPVLLALAWGCRRTDVPPAEPGAEPFVDVAAQVGLDFAHVNGMSGELYIVEMMGAGCGLLDYDNDGDLDLYLVQGHPLVADDRSPPASASRSAAAAHRDRLYRNDLVVRPDGSRQLSFTDMTEASGIEAPHYGMGVATGDYDNDGWVDLYLTNFGPNQMWRNNGDGTFSDVTRQTGTEDGSWSVGASFCDYDRDGWLDLFVANYVDFSLKAHRPCYHTSSAPDYCGPDSYAAQPDRLFRNRGDGSFEDASVPSKIAGTYSSRLGVVTADFDDDGWPDIYVANDHDKNLLWINRGDGTFVEEALTRGCALNWSAEAEASMGVEAADFDGDGDTDIIAAHMDGQTNTLWINRGGGFFEDGTRGSGLGENNFRHTTYSPITLDYDNDGGLDVLAVNGAMELFNMWAATGDPHPLREPNQLYRNLGGGRFDDVTETSGRAFKLSAASRGAAAGDVDNDGDTDLLYTNNDGPARLLVNQIGNRRHWLGLRLVDEAGRRDLLGSGVEVIRAEGPPLVRRVATDGSYGSAGDPRVLIGLGDRAEITAVRVRWPDGRVEEWTGLPVDSYSELRPGTGRVAESASR